MRNKVRLCFFVSGIFLSMTCGAQQLPMYSQYMFNALVINPAYAGSQETFTASALFRKQWVGIDGAPQTQSFSAHSPLDNLQTRRRPGSKVSLGLTLFNDRIAITDRTGLFGAYAYRLKFRNGGNFAMGFQAGVSQFRIKYSSLSLDDPAFLIGDIAEWVPDFGAGVYYNTERFYAGFSAPTLVQRSRDLTDVSMSIVPQYFLATGCVFDLSMPLKLKPNVLVKATKGSPVQLDVNCNLFINDNFEFGASWRSFESFAAMIQTRVNRRFYFGYAYDLPLGSDLSTMSGGSHEIMLRYVTPLKRIRTVNPRYF